MAGDWPRTARALRPIACTVAPWCSAGVRAAIRVNSERIFGTRISARQQRRFARRVIGSFYDFVLDVGRASKMSAEGLAGLVESVKGLDAYRSARQAGRGAVLVTAHLGTFEAGLAALAREETRIRVVFKRDSVAAFEKMRVRLHDALGVVEAPIDDGMGTLLALRDSLLNNEVVVMQGDRAVPGQRSAIVPFLHGHLRMPTGPVRLAQLTGAPIIPVFAIPKGHGKYRVLLKPPINAESEAGSANDRTSTPSKALLALAASMAEVIAEYPHQWLALEPVFLEDTEDGRR
ncbi:MAG: lysophospholipid acyltransferase family protein [Planctomycetes bacterium]|nr:lysophospholipid acyltransferase family protein [Planctomycetota bacterium]